MHKKLITISAFSLVLFLLYPTDVSAAGICFRPESGQITPDRIFKVDFLLDTEGSEVNVVSGKVFFPSEILDFERTEEGKSIVNYWMEKPKIESGNRIIFSGGLSGGFSGESGLLFSIIFRAKENSLHRSGRIDAENMQIFLNDGHGTQVNADTLPFNFTVTAEEISEDKTMEEINDADSPQDFVPYIARNPLLYGNQWFTVFYAQDNETGIDHYEVWENDKKYDINNTGSIAEAEWEKTESPYLLKNQKLQNYVYVKAVDKAGNKRIEMIPPAESSFASYRNAIIVVVIVALLFLVLLFVRKNSGAFKNKA